MSRVVLVLLVLTAFTLSACEDTAMSGDCDARVRYDGVIYRPHSQLDPSAPTGTELGGGEVVGCGTVEEARPVDQVTVFSVRGVSPSVAVKVEQGYATGVFVAEGLPRSDWPEGLGCERGRTLGPEGETVCLE